MFLQPKLISAVIFRTYKNFGHKRQPIPTVTTIWHGFLTLTLTGMCINWDKISTWVLGESQKVELDLEDD